MTATTVVCCNMISLSQTRYGSATSPGNARHGIRRRLRSYQSSKGVDQSNMRSGRGMNRV